MSAVNGTVAPEKIDFSSDQEVRWCPGCGDYSILKQVQTLLEQSGKKKEDGYCFLVDAVRLTP